MSLGMTEILIIFFLILLLFGAKKLPELARGLGRSLKEFKDATHEGINDDKKSEIESSQKKQ
ncbi:MAG TPA: twin-arginine translocase TatA/TatE family subunit [bacterium]